MCKVEFFQDESCFQLTKNGINCPYQYLPNTKNIYPDLKDDSFDIFLLNNPFLHKEVNWYEVFFDGSVDRGGFLFPISLLESEEADDRLLLSYMFVAYRKLLLKIDNEATGLLSDSFPDAFVLAVHKKTKPDFKLEDYVLSLACLGFYKYKGAIGLGYPQLDFIEKHPKPIRLEKASVNNLQNDYVRDLVINRLCLTTDFLTRFVLVYQIVELYISEIHYNLLEDSIEKYKNGQLKRNDFSEELKKISKESCQIEQLVAGFHDEKDCIKYRNEVLSLFNDVGYSYKEQSLDSLLYALRNQVFHNYSMFDGHEEALNKVIFRFERVILMLLSKKPIKQ